MANIDVSMLPCDQAAQVKKKPLSGAERVKKWREKKAANDPNFKFQESRRIQAVRKTKSQNMNADQKAENRLKICVRVRLHRLNKRLKKAIALQHGSSRSSSSPIKGRGYKTPQALGKAVRRLQSLLPASPMKQTQAIQGIAKRHNVVLQDAMNRSLSHCHANKLPTETEEKIKELYLRPDCVYTSRGMKDEITVWTEGKKEKQRKHFLVLYLKELHAIFSNDFPELKVGFSTFAKLRPKNVLLMKNSPVDQCRCKIHENFVLKLKAFGVIYSGEFWEDFLCDDSIRSKCWLNECDVCNKSKLFLTKFNDLDPNKSVKFKEWQKDHNGRLTLVEHVCTIANLKTEVESSWDKFQHHVLIKRIQGSSFEKDKNDENCTVLQIDFAMNYSCEYQDEVQSALWSRDSVTLFTAALYVRNQKCRSFLITSNSMEKGKDTVLCFLLHLVSFVKAHDIGEVFCLYTDGPSSEFKNKFCLKILTIIQKELGIECRWQYFATGHGKGVVDGIGGAAKSLVRERVMSKGGNRAIVRNAEEFAEVCQLAMPNVQTNFISQEMICDFIKHNPWDDVKEAVGISRVHTVKCIDDVVCLCPSNDHLLTNNTTCILLYNDEKRFNENVSLDRCSVGEWVLVCYDGKKYPGEIVRIDNDDVEVNVMHYKGGSWYWPDKEDKIFYFSNDVCRKIRPPVPKSSTRTRKQYSFPELPSFL